MFRTRVIHEKANRSNARQALRLERIKFEIKNLSSILCLSFVYIQFFIQYSELEQVGFIAKRLQERYRVRNLCAFI